MNDLCGLEKNSKTPDGAIRLKGENTARMKSDMKDRLKIRRKIQTLTDSLNPNEHPDGLVNIITGSTAADKVNVDMGLYI